MIEELLERKPVLAEREKFKEEYVKKNAYGTNSENGDIIDDYLGEMRIKENISITKMENHQKLNRELKAIEENYENCVKNVVESNKSDFKKNKAKEKLRKQKNKAIDTAKKNYNKIPNYESSLERLKSFDMNILVTIQESQNNQIQAEGALLSSLSEEERIQTLNNPLLIGILQTEKDETSNEQYNKEILSNFSEDASVAEMVSGCSTVIERMKQYNSKDGVEAKINPAAPYDHERFTQWKAAHNTMKLLEYRVDVKQALRRKDSEGYALLAYTAQRFELYKNYIDLQAANSILPAIKQNLDGVESIDFNLETFREKQREIRITGVSLFKGDFQEFKIRLEEKENAIADFEAIEYAVKQKGVEGTAFENEVNDTIEKAVQIGQAEANKARDKKQYLVCKRKIQNDASGSGTRMSVDEVSESAEHLLESEKNVKAYLKDSGNGKVYANIEFDQMADIYFEHYTSKLKELNGQDPSVANQSASEYALEKFKEHLNTKSMEDQNRLAELKDNLKEKNPNLDQEALEKEAQALLSVENQQKARAYKPAKLQGIRDKRDSAMRERAAEKAAVEAAEALARQKTIDEAKEIARNKAIAIADQIANQREETIKEKRAELLKDANVNDPLILNKTLDHSERAIDKMIEEAIQKLPTEKQSSLNSQEKAEIRKTIIKQLGDQVYAESDAMAAKNMELMTFFQGKIGFAINDAGLPHIAEIHRAMALKCFYEYALTSSLEKIDNKVADDVLTDCWKELLAIRAIKVDEKNAESHAIWKLDEEMKQARKQKK